MPYILYFLIVHTGFANSRFLATFAYTGFDITGLANGQVLVFDEAKINPGGHYSVSDGYYTVRNWI